MKRLAVPAASGVALGLAFPPFDLGLLAAVAPVPLLVRWRSATPASGARDGFVAGAAFFAILVVWAWYFGTIAYFPLVAALAASWAAAGALVGALAQRGVHGPFLTASVWILFEALRGRFPLGGLSWGEVGYAFHDIPVMRSLAGWGGVLLVSFVAVAAAGHLAALVASARHLREERGRRWGHGTAPLAALLSAVIILHVALPSTAPTRTLRIAVVQGNDKNRDLTADELRERFLPTSHLDLARHLDASVDLVVFPESSLDADPRRDAQLADALAELARTLDAFLLANASVDTDDGRRVHNTNFLFDDAGRLVDTYIKQHLVPFGEYIPWRRYLGFVDQIDLVPLDTAPGPGRKTFAVRGVDVANIICFESAFTEIAREYARDGAEVLMVSTNNRSFRRSANSAQHVAIGQIRAVETGRPLVQAAISGQSAFITADGDVEARTGLFERTTVVRDVTGRRGTTPYTAAGDWIVLVAGAITVHAAWQARRGSGAQRRFAGHEDGS